MNTIPACCSWTHTGVLDWYLTRMCSVGCERSARCLFSCLRGARSSSALAGCSADTRMHYLWGPVSYHSGAAMLHLLHSWFVYTGFLLLRLKVALFLMPSLWSYEWVFAPLRGKVSERSSGALASLFVCSQMKLFSLDNYLIWTNTKRKNGEKSIKILGIKDKLTSVDCFFFFLLTTSMK